MTLRQTGLMGKEKTEVIPGMFKYEIILKEYSQKASKLLEYTKQNQAHVHVLPQLIKP